MKKTLAILAVSVSLVVVLFGVVGSVAHQWTVVLLHTGGFEDTARILLWPAYIVAATFWLAFAGRCSASPWWYYAMGFAFLGAWVLGGSYWLDGWLGYPVNRIGLTQTTGGHGFNTTHLSQLLCVVVAPVGAIAGWLAGRHRRRALRSGAQVSAESISEAAPRGKASRAAWPRLRRHWALLPVAGGVLLLLGAAVAWGWWYMGGPRLIIYNVSTVELQEVVVSYRGGGHIVGPLGLGGTWEGSVSVTGDTAVTISYRLPSGEEVMHTGGQLTAGMTRSFGLLVLVREPRAVVFVESE